eukprot:gnl/Ergobibamus_cyprinoides/1702.p1 GENE.gnl/Ergobibamus_cyprinoides/1702~~gnl/Ergobibamus_cyprinoides/1702.p1  ORF type:complete len:363 (+),score=103.04 gnl/Ergobibamus_cyprinoides/1702:65-1090(+)
MSFFESADYVSCFLSDEPSSLLLSTGGDGTLYAFDTRKNGRLRDHSVTSDDEFMCMTWMKGKARVVVGSQKGCLTSFRRGKWDTDIDIFPGHPEGVDTMFAFDADHIVTGSDDGLIRIVSIVPNQLIGVLGEAVDYSLKVPKPAGISSVTMPDDRTLLAVSTHCSTLMLFDTADLAEDGDDEDGGDENAVEASDSGSDVGTSGDDVSSPSGADAKSSKPASGPPAPNSDYWDLSDEDSLDREELALLEEQERADADAAKSTAVGAGDAADDESDIPCSEEGSGASDVDIFGSGEKISGPAALAEIDTGELTDLPSGLKSGRFLAAVAPKLTLAAASRTREW